MLCSRPEISNMVVLTVRLMPEWPAVRWRRIRSLCAVLNYRDLHTSPFSPAVVCTAVRCLTGGHTSPPVRASERFSTPPQPSPYKGEGGLKFSGKDAGWFGLGVVLVCAGRKHVRNYLLIKILIAYGRIDVSPRKIRGQPATAGANRQV